MELFDLKTYIKLIDSNGCWIPNRAPHPNGYVRITIKGKRFLLHRLAVSVLTNSLYEDSTWEANHECNNPLCFNPYPKHVYKGTVSSNMFDAVKAGTHSESSKTHCKMGHPYDTRQVYFDTSRGHMRYTRKCSICRKAQRKALREAGAQK